MLVACIVVSYEFPHPWPVWYRSLPISHPSSVCRSVSPSEQETIHRGRHDDGGRDEKADQELTSPGCLMFYFHPSSMKEQPTTSHSLETVFQCQLRCAGGRSIARSAVIRMGGTEKQGDKTHRRRDVDCIPPHFDSPGSDARHCGPSITTYDRGRRMASCGLHNFHPEKHRVLSILLKRAALQSRASVTSVPVVHTTYIVHTHASIETGVWHKCRGC